MLLSMRAPSPMKQKHSCDRETNSERDNNQPVEHGNILSGSVPMPMNDLWHSDHVSCTSSVSIASVGAPCMPPPLSLHAPLQGVLSSHGNR